MSENAEKEYFDQCAAPKSWSKCLSGGRKVKTRIFYNQSSKRPVIGPLIQIPSVLAIDSIDEVHKIVLWSQ